MIQPLQKRQDEFEKPTFRAVNDSYLLLGVIDWRYGAIATIPPLVIGAALHSRIVGLLAWLVFQVIAYRIYSRDAMAPVTWVFAMIDKQRSCPFKE
jgi:hypothetical protein